MYYPCSENKDADQLRGYREADLRLCFRPCKLLVFSRTGSFCHLICMYVFQAIRTCGFWKEHNTLFTLKRLAKIDSFDTILYMYCSYSTEYRMDPVKVVCDQMSFRLN